MQKQIIHGHQIKYKSLVLSSSGQERRSQSSLVLGSLQRSARKLSDTCLKQQQGHSLVSTEGISCRSHRMVFSRSSLAAWSETPALSRSASSRLSPVHCNATKQQQQQQRQKPVVQAPSQTTALDNRQVISVEKIANTPILSAGGGGIFFWWEIGERALLD